MESTVATPMSLQYGREKAWFRILLVLAVLAWLGLTVATFGAIWIYVLLFFVFYLFAHSGFVAHLQGDAVEVTPTQFPDIDARYIACCDKLGVRERPALYLRNSDGLLNALATRFLGRHYVVLYSGVVDALADEPEALDFYIGHELGHVRLKHLAWGWFLLPVAWLPLLGPAYRRAQEYSCDLHGSACCASEKAAVDAVAVLAVGHTRWKSLDRQQWLHQVKFTGGFWMSFHELTNDYPWLTKRLAHLLRARGGEAPVPQARHPLAFLPALFVPRFGLGGGGIITVMVVVAVIGILAAVAIPAYQDYIKTAETAKQRAEFESAIQGIEDMAPGADPAWTGEAETWSPTDATTEVPEAENWLELYDKLLEADATPETQEAARQEFFMTHIAPTLEAGVDLDAAYAEFAAEYVLPAEEATAVPAPAPQN